MIEHNVRKKTTLVMQNDMLGAIALGIAVGFIPVLHVADIALFILSVLLFASLIGLRKVQKLSILPRSPICFPLIVFLVFFIPMSVAVSVSDESIAQAHVLVVGVSLMLYLSDREIPTNGYRAMIVLGALISLIGILCLQPSYKFSGISEISYAIAEFLPTHPMSKSVNGNELAGVLALFIPLSVAILLSALRRHDRSSLWFNVPVIVILMVGLVLSQSRTGFLATFAGVGTLFLLSGRWGLKRLIIGTIASGAIILTLGITRFLEVILFAGKNSGVSLNHVLSGRIDIWKTAITLIQDFPLTGIGFSSMANLISQFYSVSSSEIQSQLDAHQMFLHVFMVFGIGGGVLFIGVCILIMLMLRDLLRMKTSTFDTHFLNTGLSGSFVAMAVFGMFDTLAPGSYASLFLFLFAGLIASQHFTFHKDVLRLHSLLITIVSVACVIILFSIPSVRDVNRWNVRAVHAMKSDVRTFEMLDEMRKETASLPALNWFFGHLHRSRGDRNSATAAWMEELRHSSRHLQYLMMLCSVDTALAAFAVNHYTDNSQAHFWYASAITEFDTSRAIIAYQTGLTLDPSDGLRWRLYGDLLASSKPFEAMRAYAESGRHGDPGANGFLLAGNTAEGLGDLRLAISYYQQSRYEPALRRAGVLDSLLRLKTKY